VDKDEARQLLDEFLQDLKTKSYRKLQELIGKPECIERPGPSGIRYQIEYEAVWDVKPWGDLRIIASIDDGGLLSAMLPVTSGFIITTQGEIID
jgi:hypothetical protein